MFIYHKQSWTDEVHTAESNIYICSKILLVGLVGFISLAGCFKRFKDSFDVETQHPDTRTDVTDSSKEDKAVWQSHT